MVGTDKIPVPNKHFTDADWKNTFQKLGLPEKFEEYKIDVEAKNIDADFMKTFMQTAHSAGVLPQQAKKLVEWFVKAEDETRGNVRSQIAQQKEAQATALKAEWGAKFEQGHASASTLVSKFGDQQDQEFLTTSGLAADPRFIRFLGNVGMKVLTEDQIPQGTGGKNLYTPSQAMAEMDKVFQDMNHPYFLPDHPNHKSAVAEMAKLSEMASRKG